MAMKGSEVPVLRRPDGQAKAGPIIRRATDLMTEANIACAIMAALLADLRLERQRICSRRRSSRCRRADRRGRPRRLAERGARAAPLPRPSAGPGPPPRGHEPPPDSREGGDAARPCAESPG